MKIYRFIFFMSFLIVTGCSNEEDKVTAAQSKNEAILKDQMRALEKAKGVEKMLQNQVDLRHQAFEQQSK